MRRAAERCTRSPLEPREDGRPNVLSRRGGAGRLGRLIVCLASRLLGTTTKPRRSATTAKRRCRAASRETPFLDSWLRIEADGAVTVFTGKAELGQGIKTALLQVAAEELDVASER